MKQSTLLVVGLSLCLAAGAGRALAANPALQFGVGTQSTALIKDSTGSIVASYSQSSSLPTGFNADETAYFVPLTVVGELRDQVEASSSPDKTSIVATLKDHMGDYADEEVSSIPANLFATFQISAGFSAWCGDDLDQGTKECLGACTSSCGVGLGKCCDCVCYGQSDDI